MRQRTGKAVLIAILLFLAPKAASAACHVVTPAGSGAKSGADWNNAYAGLPGTLTNGDTYYLADGSYGHYNLVVSSGSARTYVKKATAADNCTATGWNVSTMGSSQAVFTGIVFTTTGNSNNVTFDGNGVSKQPGCGASPATAAFVPASDCGFKVDDSGCTGGADACDGPISLSVYQGSPVIGAVFRYMEWYGNGSNNTGNNREQNFVNAPQTNGAATFTFQHIYSHDIGCVVWQDYSSPTYVIEYNYFWGNWSNPNQCHGQLTYDYGSQNSMFRYNIVRDIEGTAVFTFDDGAHPNNWYAYGNLFYYSSGGSVHGQTGNGDAIIACQNPGSVCTNMYFYDNTVVNWNYTTGIMADNGGGSYIWEDNLIYQATQNPGGGTGNPGGITFNMNGSSLTEDYNTAIYSGGGLSGPHDVTVNSQTPVPFVNWTANSNETVNFALTGENVDWNAGLALSIVLPTGCTSGTNCFNVDPMGTLRGADGAWDRGAFQLGSGTPLVPPATLAITGVQ